MDFNRNLNLDPKFSVQKEAISKREIEMEAKKGARMRSVLRLTINGKPYTIDGESLENLDAEYSLADFIRDDKFAGLKGTKIMCRAGQCGLCMVTVCTKDPVTGRDVYRGLDSCLVPVLGCDGWEIYTIESLGNRDDGYHPFVQALVKTGGTQCGFCSPGFVMNMNSLAKSQKNLTEKEIEDSFDGNYCRCVGYRSILDAFKPFATNGDSRDDDDENDDSTVNPESSYKDFDIETSAITCGCAGCPCKRKSQDAQKKEDGVKSHCEEAAKMSCCQTSKADDTKCCESMQNSSLENEKSEMEMMKISNLQSEKQQQRDSSTMISLPNGQVYVTARTIQTAFNLVDEFKSKKKNFTFVAGNTQTGQLDSNSEKYDAFIDINNIRELHVKKVSSSSVTIGGGNNLTSSVKFFEKIGKKPGFEYMREFARQLKLVDSHPIRNADTLAGNLVDKHNDPRFPSDVFVLFEAVGAQITIASSVSKSETISLMDFMSKSVYGKLVISLTFKPVQGDYFFRGFRVGKRYESSHPYVNAAMLFKIDRGDDCKVVEKPSIVYGGISPKFSHAIETEKTLNGAKLAEVETLQQALNSLKLEVKADFHPPEASPKYRKKLAINFLYKMILEILGEKVNPVNSSGASDISRNLSRGEQTFPKHPGQAPLYKAVHKLEAYSQVAGEEEYINDIPTSKEELSGALVLSKVGPATIESIDASDALAIPGVYKFLKASDLPGKNDAFGENGFAEVEPIFAEREVVFAGQALGLIVAENHSVACKAAEMVKVKYSNTQKPILTVDEAITKAKEIGTYPQIFEVAQKSQKDPSKIPTRTISGQVLINSQAHAQTETHVTLCCPDVGTGVFNVYCASQGLDHVQDIVSRALDIPANQVKVNTRQLGGGFGSKQTRPSLIAAACALAAKCMRRPVRVVIDLETNFELIGKRFPTKAEYEVGIDDDGRIMSLKCQVICDCGAFFNETTSRLATNVLQSCYKAFNWELTPGHVTTNTAPNTKNRAPGRIKGIAIIEYIIEHIAFTLKMDPIQVRLNNFIELGDPIFVTFSPAPTLREPNILPRLLTELEKKANVRERKVAVEDFNRMNRWKKRGITVCTMRYAQRYTTLYGVYIAIYHQDGTVVVQMGCIEMGQGLNTKVAQTVAYEFGISLDKVRVEYSNNIVGANSGLTQAAQTSEAACFAAEKSCKELKSRIKKVLQENNMENATWEESIKLAHSASVDLRATYFFKPSDVDAYDIYGVNCVEVELDCLTGDYKILRSDLLQDAGKSLSPEIDIGQTEGAYVYGAGLWTSEELIYDKETGRLLTSNLKTYKPPFSKSIPEDFRVTLIDTRPNPFGVLGSKATGEAPIALTCTIVLALKSAIQAARKDAGNEEWFDLETPLTPERVLNLSLTKSSQFSY